MLEITLKNKKAISDATPQYHRFHIWGLGNGMSEEDNKNLQDIKTGDIVKLNGRRCLTKSGGWQLFLEVLDEPTRTVKANKLRQSEIDADNLFKKYCQTGNVGKLFIELAYLGGSAAYKAYFIARILKNLEGAGCHFELNGDCDDCQKRFECYTTKTPK